LSVIVPVFEAEVFSSVTAPEPEAIVRPPEPIVRLPALVELLVMMVVNVLVTTIPPIVCAVPPRLAVWAALPANTAVSVEAGGVSTPVQLVFVPHKPLVVPAHVEFDACAESEDTIIAAETAGNSLARRVRRRWDTLFIGCVLGFRDFTPF
jgi:hypothetical protein